MYTYNMFQWLFIFYFYCFFGWCFESAYVSVCHKKLVNRGFMRGPFLPLYGSGAVMMLVVSTPFRESLLLVFIAGMAGATVLELVTGTCMEALFKVRYWDYSNQKFQYKGYICLSSSIAWGFLTILMTKVVHRPVEAFMLGIPITLLSVIVFLVTVMIVVDFTLAFRAALDLREVLIRLEKVKEDVERMQKRMDVLIAVMKEATEDKTDEIKEELMELKNRAIVYLEHRKDLKERFGLEKKRILRGNPSMTSKRFGEALEELKEAAKRKKKK